MKVLIIGERFYPEEFLINDIAVYWADNGHEIHVLTQNPSYPFGKIFSGYKNKIFQTTTYKSIVIHRVYTICGYKDSKIKKILNYFIFPILGTVHVILHGKKYNLVFVYQTGSLLQAIPGILLHKLHNTPVNIWTWDIWPDGVYAYGFKPNIFLKTFLNWIVKFIYNSCDNIFISSPGFKDLLNKLLFSKEYIVAPNWNPPEDAVDHRVIMNNGYNFTFAGNIGKVQNLDNIIRGFYIAQQKISLLQLNIIGDGSALEDLKILVNNLKATNIHFWGRVPSNKINSYYNSTDAMIISLIPNTALESYIPSKFQAYLSTGKPILCAMRGPVADMVVESQIGIATYPDNIIQISEAFIRISTFTQKQLSSINYSSKKLLNAAFNRKRIIDKITNIVFSKA